MDQFPSQWRIAGTSIYRNLHREVVDRKIYGILNYLGDIGGLEGLLFLAGKLIIFTYISFTANAYFIEKLYHSKPNY